MKKLVPLFCATLALAASAPASAELTVATTTITSIPTWWWTVFQPTWLCEHWDGTACTGAELGNSWYRQVVMVPTGYQEADRAQFWTDFHTIRGQMANAGTTWSTQKRGQILWIGYFIPGAAADVRAGHRRLNWVWYVRADAEEVARLLVDKDGNSHRASLSPGLARPDAVSGLHALAKREVHPMLAELVAPVEVVIARTRDHGGLGREPRQGLGVVAGSSIVAESPVASHTAAAATAARSTARATR